MKIIKLLIKDIKGVKSWKIINMVLRYGLVFVNLFSKTHDFTKTYELVNKIMKGIKSEKIKVKMWFGDKDLSS